ncbi:hypothetical protein B4168_0568 [Anoxybacillus flavithermus]|nr:hypothetical protein B4168_0568 [Anoxybacillus flavithermus]OAO86578.1 hypothetical protein GT23_1596 [Parageobacillus thermoglucosidasius]
MIEKRPKKNGPAWTALMKNSRHTFTVFSSSSAIHLNMVKKI